MRDSPDEQRAAGGPPPPVAQAARGAAEDASLARHAPGAAPTIAALATARGTAALAVVRASGPEAVALVASRFSDAGLAEAAGRTVWVGWLRDGEGAPVDQVVCTVWRAPHSSTGEDVVEVTCHGGDAVAQAVLRVLYDAGARPAEAGEFTQRAFLNGKLDLAQAEAVADLISAESRLGHRAAVSALRGGVSEAVGSVRQSLVQTAALVELELDFGEEDVSFADRTHLAALLADADRQLAALVGTARLGALARDGVTVVLGGRPNAGKSTLLNALTGEDRAIVSPTPGTTRDAVTAEAELAGLRFRFVDTAGLRETADAVEAEGTRRARAAIDAADVLVYVVDATVGLDAEERAFLEGLAGRRPELAVLVVENKADLLDRRAPPTTSPLPLGEGQPTGRRSQGEGEPGAEAGRTPLTPALADADAGAVSQREGEQLQPQTTSERDDGRLDRESSASVDPLCLSARGRPHRPRRARRPPPVAAGGRPRRRVGHRRRELGRRQRAPPATPGRRAGGRPPRGRGSGPWRRRRHARARPARGVPRAGPGHGRGHHRGRARRRVLAVLHRQVAARRAGDHTSPTVTASRAGVGLTGDVTELRQPPAGRR